MGWLSHPFTLFNLGFLRFAEALAFLVEAAKIAPARSCDTPLRFAMLFCTEAKPGCFFAISPSLFSAPRGGLA
jgi:hypothetical protein